jgi:hypothetical protein
LALVHEKLDVYRLSIGCVAWVYENREDGLDPDPDSDLDLEGKTSQPRGGRRLAIAHA